MFLNNVKSGKCIQAFVSLSDRGTEHEGQLQGDISICPHGHDIYGSEQGQRFTGSLLRGGVTQDGLHHQLQHVSPGLVLQNLIVLICRIIPVFIFPVTSYI